MADIHAPFCGYVSKMLTFTGREKGTTKVLILDEETTQSISVTYSQSDILQYDVFLTEKIGSKHDPQKHLIAVMFIRPTPENVKLICAELEKPKYKAYHIYFTNIVRRDAIQEIATADEQSLVREIHEFYGDFVPIDLDHFTLNQMNGMQLCRAPSQWKGFETSLFNRCVDSIVSVCLAMKQRPHIRYQAVSESTARVAREVLHQINREDQRGNLFDYHGACELIIMDRRSDPVTPLLTQWRYQSMIHEFFPVVNNRITIQSATEVEEFVFNPFSDDFIKAHQWSDFGTLMDAIKEHSSKFKAADERKNKLIKDDLATFVDEIKDFKLLEYSAKRHITITHELNRIVKQHNLMPMSAVEQAVACSNDQNGHYEKIMELVTNQGTSKEDAVRLVVLYGLHYGGKGGSRLEALLEALKAKGIAQDRIAIVDSFLKFSPPESRVGDIFSQGITGLMQNISKTVKGQNNAYMQHKPYLATVLEQAKKKKLKETDYPTEGASLMGTPDTLIVFVIGGTTYEEAHSVREMNKTGQLRVVLGGTNVLNSDMFMQGLKNF